MIFCFTCIFLNGGGGCPLACGVGALTELCQLLRVLHAVVDGARALLRTPARGRDGARVLAEVARLLRAVTLATDGYR